VFLTAAWWLMAAEPAAAQTWKEILGAATQEQKPQAEEAQPVENNEVQPAETVAAEPVDSVEAVFALKEALLIGAENSVAMASQLDGFNANPEIRITLPPKLELARETLSRFGLGPEVDNLELAMNRAAEGAAADALPLLRDAIRDLPIDDPLATLGAGGSAATDSLRAGAGEVLLERLTPIVSVKMEQAGVAGAYDRLAQKGGNLVTQAGVGKEDLTPYVTGRTLDGLFTLIAAEESAIRSDQAARTTPLLARVFASTQSAPTDPSTESQPADEQPGDDDTQLALKEALEIGAIKAVESASKNDGFFGNPMIRIPMPESVEKVGQSLRNYGMGQVVDDFELSMNRAAEMAAAEATPILIDAVKSISFDDAMSILKGGDTAATDTLRAKTEDSLTAVFEPIVTTKMDEAGVTRSYEQLMKQGGSLMSMFGGGSQPDLPAYVTAKTLDGLFALIAEEEAKIRKDPVARTTNLLRSIFGSLGR
jgi:hypothetical protein